MIPGVLIPSHLSKKYANSLVRADIRAVITRIEAKIASRWYDNPSLCQLWLVDGAHAYFSSEIPFISTTRRSDIVLVLQELTNCSQLKNQQMENLSNIYDIKVRYKIAGCSY